MAKTASAAAVETETAPPPDTFKDDVARLCVDLLNTPAAGMFHERVQALLAACGG